MKKFNCLIGAVIGLYLLAAAGLLLMFARQEKAGGREYLVEIHRILQSMEQAGGYYEPDLEEYSHITGVEFLEEKPLEAVAWAAEREMIEQDDQEELVKEFFWEGSGENTIIQPLYTNHVLAGYVRFSRGKEMFTRRIWLVSEGAMAVLACIVIAFLLYIRHEIIVPFQKLEELPYELAKGHLKGELSENKSRYFGKFTWGLTMLAEHLDYHRKKELELEREKKLLLLSISHDIKTPLSTIRLYAKAFTEGIYRSREEIREAAEHIQTNAGEIESFVKEIVKSSSEDVIHIEVENGEFYLRELMEKVLGTYREKCAIHMTELWVEEYDNKLLKGDLERSYEVLENLFENALKYGDGRQIRIEFGEEDYCQLIRVFNTGEPMAEGEINHIFDSFFRGSNTDGKQGNGLGLYICREIMHKMEGEIFAESMENGMGIVLVFRE